MTHDEYSVRARLWLAPRELVVSVPYRKLSFVVLHTSLHGGVAYRAPLRQTY